MFAWLKRVRGKGKTAPEAHPPRHPASGQRALTPPAKKSRHSPLAQQLFSFNLLALTIPTLGLLYLGDYGQSFSEIERDFARNSVEIIAANVAQHIKNEQIETGAEVALSKEIFSDYISPATLHRGTLYIYVLDPYRQEAQDAFSVSIQNRLTSSFMFGVAPDKDTVGTTRLGWQISLSNFLLNLKTDLLPNDRSLLTTLPREAIEASPNFTSVHLHRTSAGHLTSAAATGVSGIGTSDMVFFMVHDSSRLDVIMMEQFKRVVFICLAALFFALFLGIVMYARFVRPIQILAAASEQLGLGVGRTVRFSMTSDRKDELGELSRALARMAESLQYRLQAAEGFAADLAHEIKNPLASLRNSASLLASNRNPETSKKLETIVHKDVGRLNALVNEILAASRLQADLLVGEENPTSLRALLDEVSKMMLAAGGEKNLELEIDLPPADEPCLVLAHEHRMAEALRNLILNAVSFSPQGGRIMMGLRPEPPPETLAAQSDFALPTGGYWVAIEDQGPGIVSGKEERIFERFYTERAHQADEGAGEANGEEERHFGLGLDNVRQVMNAHHGYVWARNHKNRGGGAGFYLFLPAYAAPAKSGLSRRERKRGQK